VKRKASPSLTTRLGVLFAVIAAVTFAAIGSYLYDSLARQLAERDDGELLERMEYIRHLLEEAPSIDVVPHRFTDAVEGHEGLLLQIKRQDGTVLLQNDTGMNAPPPLPIAAIGSDNQSSMGADMAPVVGRYDSGGFRLGGH